MQMGVYPMPNLTIADPQASAKASPFESDIRARSVAEAILEQLRLWGVERIYGVVGDAIFGLMDAIAKQNDIEFITVKHESAAALMASAEAKYTGRLGVCAAQMGPGLANLLNGLGDAFLDRVPVLAITGQAPVNKLGTAYKQYINEQELVQAIVGFSRLAAHPDAAMECLGQALHTAVSARTVAHLSIPADLFGKPTLWRPYEPVRSPDVNADPAQLQRALQWMRQAKRPMILLGKPAASAGKDVMLLAERWGAGIALAYGAVGSIPDDFHFGLGGLGEGGNPYVSGLFKEADVVLAVGADEWPKDEQARIIRIERDLATLGFGLPADCPIAGDETAVVAALFQGLAGCGLNQDWIGQIRRCKQTWSEQNEQEGNQTLNPLHPSRIFRIIEQCIAPDAVVALDEGDSTLWFMRNFRARREQVLLSCRWRTMGFGLPAAMAAKLCAPHKQVVCLTGDGGLAMVLADLLTAARYGLSITMIVINNGMLQMERNKMTAQGLVPEGTEITNPDFVQVAEACGWRAWRVQSADELKLKLTEAAASAQGPVLLDVITAQAVYPFYPKS